MSASEDLRDPFRPLVVVDPRQPQTGLLLLLHGLGDSGRGMRSLAEGWAASLPHVKFVVPSAPVYPGEGGRPQSSWFGRDQAGRTSGISRPWCELLQFIESDRVRHGVPLSRVVFVGFSQGAYMSSWAALQMPRACGGLVLLSGGVPGGLKVTEEAKKTPVLYCTGAQDPIVTTSTTRSARDTLRYYGFQVSYFEYPNLGHSIDREEVEFVLGFLRTVLPQQAAEPTEAQGFSLAADIRRLGGEPCSELRIPNGAVVVIHSLVSTPQHNGKQGKILGFNSAKRRFTVGCGQGQELALRPDNITQRLRVELLAVRREGDFAGCLSSRADIIGADEGPDGVEAYRLELPDTGRVTRLPPDRVLVAEGAVLRLLGLRSERGRGLVGRFCRVGTLRDGRYHVDVEAEAVPITVLPRHLRP